MERIQALIDQLYRQKEQNASPATLLLTTQLLQAELVKLQAAAPYSGSQKVAVTLPFQLPVHGTPAFSAPVTEDPADKIVFELEPTEDMMKEAEEEVSAVEEPQEEEPSSVPSYSLRPPVQEEPRPVVSQSSFFAAFQETEEAPTLVQHQPSKELHEVIADSKESLNDRLKQEKKEVAHSLKDAPIRDLRKGIGINDRFTFVSELFRGDDAMYERSIKTINNFNILSEAEYWISRELKYKLGWDDDKPVVQHFYQLVKRRFA